MCALREVAFRDVIRYRYAPVSDSHGDRCPPAVRGNKSYLKLNTNMARYGQWAIESPGRDMQDASHWTRGRQQEKEILHSSFLTSGARLGERLGARPVSMASQPDFAASHFAH